MTDTERITWLRDRAAQFRSWAAEAERKGPRTLSNRTTAEYWNTAAFQAELEASLLEGVQPVETLESITA